MQLFIQKLINNKVIIYLIVRYFIYFIQLVTSIIIAVKLGPYYFGIWGFVLLLINYFQITNLGVSNSLGILMVQFKNDREKERDLVKTSFLLIGCLCIIVLFVALYYYFIGIPYFEKYEIGNLFYFVCLIAMMSYFNYLLLTIYRVKNRLFEIAFFQAIIPLLVFLVIFIFKGNDLLKSLIGAYIIGHALSLIIFLSGKSLPRSGYFNSTVARQIFNKGFYLFIYNLCFYLIIISSKTIISVYYTVEQFGFFMFSYTLANAVMLLLEAFSFLVFPKIVYKFNTDDSKIINRNISLIRSNYVTLAHGLMYLALIAFPIFINLIPKFQNAQLSFSLLSLTVLLYSNSFGYNTFLLAKNEERIVTKVAIISLLMNIVISILLIKVFKVNFELVIFSTIIAYFAYGYLCVYYGKKRLNQDLSFLNILLDFIPLKLLIPYLCAVFIVLYSIPFLYIIPLIVFIVLNRSNLKEILITTKLIINKPEFINIE